MAAKLAPTIRQDPRITQRLVPAFLVVCGCTGLSTFFACVTPFAAFATFAALNTSRFTAVLIVLLAWMANQVVGYSLLGYPLGANSLAWGAAIGGSACLAVFAARAFSNVRSGQLSISLPFVAAFVTYEFGLYAVAMILPGGNGVFTASIVGYVLLVNLGALILLTLTYALIEFVADCLVSSDPKSDSIPQIS